MTNQDVRLFLKSLKTKIKEGVPTESLVVAGRWYRKIEEQCEEVDEKIKNETYKATKEETKELINLKSKALKDYVDTIEIIQNEQLLKSKMEALKAEEGAKVEVKGGSANTVSKSRKATLRNSTQGKTPHQKPPGFKRLSKKMKGSDGVEEGPSGGDLATEEKLMTELLLTSLSRHKACQKNMENISAHNEELAVAMAEFTKEGRQFLDLLKRSS